MNLDDAQTLVVRPIVTGQIFTTWLAKFSNKKGLKAASVCTHEEAKASTGTSTPQQGQRQNQPLYNPATSTQGNIVT